MFALRKTSLFVAAQDMERELARLENEASEADTVPAVREPFPEQPEEEGEDGGEEGEEEGYEEGGEGEEEEMLEDEPRYTFMLSQQGS